jgi:DNA-binding MarR family transcriptional regulator
MTTDLVAAIPDATRRGGAAPATPISATDPRLGAWRSLLRAHARLSRRLDEELQANHALSLAEYDAMLQLANEPGRRLRMSVLAERVLLSRSGITRLVDRLETAGMVERSACPTDARGAMAALTPVGLERLRAASGTHLGGVARYFLDVVTAEDQAAIRRGLDAVSARIAAGGDDGGATVGDTPCSIPGEA